MATKRNCEQDLFGKLQPEMSPAIGLRLQTGLKNRCKPWSHHATCLFKKGSLYKWQCPRKSREECKESESEVVVDTKLSIPNLEVKISEVEESGSGSGSSSGALGFPRSSNDSSKSSQINQSSHDTSDLDSREAPMHLMRPDTSGRGISTSDATALEC